jgi:thioredoxin-like negative regulator of GroEL
VKQSRASGFQLFKPFPNMLSFILADLATLGFVAVVSWWLSGYDTRLTWDNKREDAIRRAVRCGITLVLVQMAFLGLWRYWHNDDRASGMLYLMFSLPLALIWAGCLSELAARSIHGLIDPEDKREFDPNKRARDLDTVASLIKNGRKEEAIQLCQSLKESGDASLLAMDALLENLGVPQAKVERSKPLADADRLRLQGKFQDAESLLNSLLVENPANLDAAMMLMRLYVQDLRQGNKAREVLRRIEQQPHVSRAYIEYAGRSIGEWSQDARLANTADPVPESVEQLLERGYFGTAIEVLEQKLKEQPQDFDAWIQLAGTYGLKCGNLDRAKKIIDKVAANPAFNLDQIQLARAKLKEWREAHPPESH